MAQKTCNGCGGMGSLVEYQRVPSTSGGMFDQIEVRRPCGICGGTGSIWEADPFIPKGEDGTNDGHFTSGRPASPKASFEETVAGWMVLALWGVIGYLGITTTNLEWYWPVGVGLAVSVGVYKLLLSQFRPLLKTIGKLAIFLIVCGVVLLVLYLIGRFN